MVLGHNFHNIANYEESVRRGGENHTPTWRNLERLLDACGINQSECFFTNALMGLMESAFANGSCLGHKDPAFRKDCRDVLEASLARQQPRLILALGKSAQRLLGEVIPELRAWSGSWTFPKFDAYNLWNIGLTLGCPVMAGRIAAAVVVHPSLRGSNLRHQKFQHLAGAEAEVAMVRQAMCSSGILDIQEA